MLITNVQQFISAALSGSAFVLDQAGGLHTDEAPPGSSATSPARESWRKHVPADQALRRRMVEIVEPSFPHPFAWESLLHAGPEMGSRELASDIVKLLLLAQTGPNVDSQNPVISAWLMNTVEQLPGPSGPDRAVLLRSVASALAREPLPVPSLPERFRELIENCVQRSWVLLQQSASLCGAGTAPPPELPVAAGAAGYSVQSREAAFVPEDFFAACFSPDILPPSVAVSKNLQRIRRESASCPGSPQRETGERGGGACPEEAGQERDPAPWSPPAPSDFPGLEVLSVFPSAPVPVSSLVPSDQLLPDTAQWSPPAPSDFPGLEVLSVFPSAPVPVSPWAPPDRLLPDAASWSPSAPPELPGFEVLSVFPPPPVPISPLAPSDHLLPDSASWSPSVPPELPGFEVLSVFPSPSAPTSWHPSPDRPPPPVLNIAAPPVRAAVLEAAESMGSPVLRERYSVVLFQQYLSAWLMDAEPDASVQSVDSLRSLLAVACKGFRKRLLLKSPLPGNVEVREFIREETARLLALCVRKKHPRIESDILAFYATHMLEEAVQTEETPAGTVQTAEARLCLAALQLGDMSLLECSDWRLDTGSSVVKLALDYFSRNCSPPDATLIKRAVTLLLQASRGDRLRQPLVETVKSYIEDARRVLDELASESPEETLAPYRFARQIHADRMVPAARERFPGASPDLLRCTIPWLFPRNAPSYERERLEDIETKLFSVLEYALTTQNMLNRRMHCSILRPDHYVVRGAVQYGLRKTKAFRRNYSKEDFLFNLNNILRDLPVKYVQPSSLPAFMENICLNIIGFLRRMDTESSGAVPVRRRTGVAVRICMLMEARHTAFPVSSRLLECLIEAVTEKFDAEGRKILGRWRPNIHRAVQAAFAALADPAQAGSPSGRFDTAHPAVLASVASAVREAETGQNDIPPKLFQDALLVLLGATPVARTEAPLAAVAGRAAEALLDALGGRNCQIYQKMEFPEDGEAGRFLVRGLGGVFRSLPVRGAARAIYSGYYTGWGSRRFFHHGRDCTFLRPGESLNAGVRVRMMDALIQLYCTRSMHCFLTVIASRRGFDQVAERLLLSEMAREARFAGFVSMLAEGLAFVEGGEIRWEGREISLLKIIYTYTLGFFVKNPFTGAVQAVQAAALTLGIQIDLNQRLQMNALPEFLAIKTTVEPLPPRDILPELLQGLGGPGVDPGSALVRALLRQAVTRQSAVGNTELLLCCAAEILAGEQLSVPPALDSLREAVGRSVRTACCDFANPALLFGPGSVPDINAPGIKGAVRYFTENRKGEDPGTAESFRRHFEELLQSPAVDTSKNLQELCEALVPEAENRVRREQGSAGAGSAVSGGVAGRAAHRGFIFPD